jgi:Tfp pilus assembly protein PilX
MKLVFNGKHTQRGTVVVIVLALIAIMSLFIMFNAQSLYTLKRSLKLTEKRQIEHWTNYPPLRATVLKR